MLLAVIMLLSVMPVAYAERATYSPELEQYIEIWTRVQSYRDNKYAGGYGDNKDKPNADFDKVFEIVNGAYRELIDIVGKESAVPEPGSEDFKNIDLDVVPIFNRIMQPAIEEVEEKIASGEIKVVINVYEFYKYYHSVVTYHDINDFYNIETELYFMNNPKYADMYNEMNNGIDEMYRYREDPADDMTQAEFDAIWKEKYVPFYDMVIDCLDGNHPYGEYISNNDATEEADGTKTATCEFCGATDTVIDEGSKLVKEPASFFERLIALIKEFFAKILSIFG